MQKNERPLLVHVANVRASRDSGMGRIAWHWLQAFEARGWDVWHLGPEQTPKPLHKTLWAKGAFATLQRSGRKAHCILSHEPHTEPFRLSGIPTVLFSHGIESRGAGLVPLANHNKNLREILLAPFWRWKQRCAHRSIRFCPLLLLSNQDDARHATTNFGRKVEDIFVFRNGVDPVREARAVRSNDFPTILFYASWILRKGTDVLLKTALYLHQQGVRVKWLLAGTGVDVAHVMASWPEFLRSNLDVIPHVDPDKDDYVYRQADIFVLPSYFEGQPLTLLQGMAHGLCCITTESCGQKDLIQHGNNGLLFPVGDAVRLTSLLTDCIISPSLSLQLGDAAKASVQERTWGAVSHEVVDQIEVLKDRTHF
jgi:glycosyltransferase involved in cell wall biosynthesis